MPLEELILSLVLPMAVLAAGVSVIVSALRYRARIVELVHQERLAMIERGMVPPDAHPGSPEGRHLSHTARGRSFSAGIVFIGLGLAFMVLIGVAAQSPNEAIGIGGAIVILGLSFIVHSLLTHRALPPATPQPLPEPRRPAPSYESEFTPRRPTPPPVDPQ
ncbi:MAG: DUF6249 domain-containing protein [Vicinamibacterales bacterium]